jgi:hypothetical protein
MLPLLLAASLPALLWDKRPETLDLLRAAQIPCIAVTPPAAKAWARTGYCVTEVRPEELVKLDAPGVSWGTRDVGTASATRAPWIDANGWRFLREPAGRYLYEELPHGSAPLAAAEAFTYGVQAWLRIDPRDLKPLAAMLAFLESIGADAALKPAADIAVIDNGSPSLPEVLNLLARRNLLFRVVKAPDPAADLNVRIGSPEFPESEAADPAEFAGKLRRRLTDRKRLLRIYGSEVVLGRVLTDKGRARIHLLNYTSQKVEALRVRVDGAYAERRPAIFGYPETQLTDSVVRGGATEFTIPEMGAYAVIDLTAAR